MFVLVSLFLVCSDSHYVARIRHFSVFQVVYPSCLRNVCSTPIFVVRTFINWNFCNCFAHDSHMPQCRTVVVRSSVVTLLQSGIHRRSSLVFSQGSSPQSRLSDGVHEPGECLRPPGGEVALPHVERSQAECGIPGRYCARHSCRMRQRAGYWHRHWNT